MHIVIRAIWLFYVLKWVQCIINGYILSPIHPMCVCVCVCGAGMTVGGVWGVGEGIQRGTGLSTRLRATAIVNGLTRRGPFLANNFAVLGQCSVCLEMEP